LPGLLVAPVVPPTSITRRRQLKSALDEIRAEDDRSFDAWITDLDEGEVLFLESPGFTQESVNGLEKTSLKSALIAQGYQAVTFIAIDARTSHKERAQSFFWNLKTERRKKARK